MAPTANDQSLTDQLPDQVQETAAQAKQAVQEVARRAQETVRAQVDQRSTEVGQTAANVSQAARGASEQLRGQGEDLAAQVIEQAAGRVEQLGQYLRESSADRILRDVEDFARSQPWAVILGGVVAVRRVALPQGVEHTALAERPGNAATVHAAAARTGAGGTGSVRTAAGGTGSVRTAAATRG